MRREILHDAGLRRPQLDRLGPDVLLREFLGEPGTLQRRAGAFRVQLLAIRRCHLGESPHRLFALRRQRGDRVPLGGEIVLALDVLALSLEREELADEALGGEPRVAFRRRPVNRHRALELVELRRRRREIPLDARERRRLLALRVVPRASVGAPLGVGPCERLVVVARMPCDRRLVDFRVDAAQLQRALRELAGQRAQFGLRERRVQANEHVAGDHLRTFGREYLAHDTAVRRLHDLEARARHEATVGYGDDVEAARVHPDGDGGDQRAEDVKQPSEQRRGRRRVLPQSRGVERLGGRWRWRGRGGGQSQRHRRRSSGASAVGREIRGEAAGGDQCVLRSDGPSGGGGSGALA